MGLGSRVWGLGHLPVREVLNPEIDVLGPHNQGHCEALFGVQLGESIHGTEEELDEAQHEIPHSAAESVES